MIGEARVTSIRADSLSSVTVRGAEITLASALELRNDRTAFTPSASRKAVAGLNPLAVSSNILGQSVDKVEFSLSVGLCCCKLLPKARCWFWSVPDQSIPFLV